MNKTKIHKRIIYITFTTRIDLIPISANYMKAKNYKGYSLYGAKWYKWLFIRINIERYV